MNSRGSSPAPAGGFIKEATSRTGILNILDNCLKSERQAKGGLTPSLCRILESAQAQLCANTTQTGGDPNET